MSGLDGMLLSTGATIALTYNIRPKQKLAQHTENSEHQDQPHLPELNPNYTVSLSPSICFSKLSRKMRNRPQLVTVRFRVLPDGSFFSCGAVFGEIDPNKPDCHVQNVVAQNQP
jgi:hypothetical protein